MRQICPNCLKSLEVPDTSAGQDYTCPSCSKPFPVPPGYAPTVPQVTPLVSPQPLPVERPAAPPGLAPSGPIPGYGAAPPPGLAPTYGYAPGYAPPGLAPAPAPAPQPAASASYVGNPPAAAGAPAGPHEHTFSVSLQPYVLKWIPFGSIVFAFLMTFFSWNGLYPGNVTMYYQNPYQAVFGSYSDNSGLPNELLKDDKDLSKRVRANVLLLLPYLLLTIAAVGFATLERFLHDPNFATIPGPLAFVVNLWPKRDFILAILCLVVAGLLVLQTLWGFGLEMGARQLAYDRAAAQIQEDPSYQSLNDSRKAAQQSVEYGRKLGELSPSGTIWRQLAILAHLLAAVTSIGRLWLDQRGNKPLPELTLKY